MENMKNPLKNLIKHQDKLIDSLKKTNDILDELFDINHELIDELEKLNSSLGEIEEEKKEEKIGFKVGINRNGIRSFFCFKENAEFEGIIKKLKSGESINIEKV